MKVKLEQSDYVAISNIVREQLKDLLPENEMVNRDLTFGPEFMASALRISTPSTQVQFTSAQKEYVKNLRQEIKNDATLSDQEKQLKNKQLNSIILFGQILFAQSACLHFLTMPDSLNKKEDKGLESLKNHFNELSELAQREGILQNSSRFEALSRRKAFNVLWQETKNLLKNSPLTEEEKYTLLKNLYNARDFYYQVNDLNFRYANKPSRNFSTFVNSYAHYGSKIALIASIIAIGATALAFIPPLTPFMAPIALVASTISLAIGMPISLKNLGTMFYNLIRFGAEPTPAELLNAVMLSTTFILSGSASLVSQAVTAGALNHTANDITSAVGQATGVTKITLGVKGQLSGINHANAVAHYKAELAKISPKEEVADENNLLNDLP